MSSASNQPSEEVAKAAAHWVLRHDRGLTPAEQDAFLHWLSLDASHGLQFSRHRQNWQRLEVLAHWRPEHSTRPNPDLLASPRKQLLRFAPKLVLAAAALVAAFFIFRKPTVAPAVLPVATLATPASKIATQQTLEDGTIVEMNQGTVMSVHFTKTERRVSLEQGEAHFTVTKNPSRPFIVTARGMDVFAVGTAFNVRLDQVVVEVLVTEGRVRVSEASDESGTDIATLADKPPVVPLLQAGQRAVVSLSAQPTAPQIATLTPGEIERVLAWQHRLLDFTAAPMSEVVAAFNRRNHMQLILVDPELAEIRISATFRSDNIEGFVRLVEMGFSTRAERHGESEIRLHNAR